MKALVGSDFNVVIDGIGIETRTEKRKLRRGKRNQQSASQDRDTLVAWRNNRIPVLGQFRRKIVTQLVGKHLLKTEHIGANVGNVLNYGG